MRQLKTFMRKRKKEMLACGPCECRTLQCWRYANENCGCGEAPEETWILVTFNDINCRDFTSDQPAEGDAWGTVSELSIRVPEWTTWSVDYSQDSKTANIIFTNDGEVINTVQASASPDTSSNFYFIDEITEGGWAITEETSIGTSFLRVDAVTIPIEVTNYYRDSENEDRIETEDAYWTVSHTQTITVPMGAHVTSVSNEDTSDPWVKTSFYDPMDWWIVVETIMCTPNPVWDDYLYLCDIDPTDYYVDEDSMVNISFFKDPVYTITINVNDESLGSVNKSLSYANARDGQNFDFLNNEMYLLDTIIATPAEGNALQMWTYDDDTQILQWDPITWDMTIIAKFGNLLNNN